MRLHRLLTGEVLAPPGLRIRRGPGPIAMVNAVGVGTRKSSWNWIPVPAFLIEHPSAGPVLVDTGLHPDAPSRAREVLGLVAAILYDYRTRPEQAVDHQLRDRGVNPAELRAVVMTHLHTDHAAGVPLVSGSTFIVDRVEWKATKRPDAVMYYSRVHVDRSLDWRAIDYNEAAAPHGPFQRTLDLFGDGSVRLLATPGHTAGHQSLLVRLRDREALICADAAYTRDAITDGVMPGLANDWSALRDSLARIQRYAAANPDAVIIPGHDTEAWRELDSVYE